MTIQGMLEKHRQTPGPVVKGRCGFRKHTEKIKFVMIKANKVIGANIGFK